MVDVKRMIDTRNVQFADQFRVAFYERLHGGNFGRPADQIRADMLPPEIGSGAPALLTIDPTADIMGLPLREARDLFETQYLQAQLMRFGGNISRTAQFVGMERSALHRKLKQLGVNSDEKVGG